MNQGLDLKINRIPALTWNRLRMNEAELNNVLTDRQGTVDESVPEEIERALYEAGGETDSVWNMKTGMGPDCDRLIEACDALGLSYRAEKGIKIKEPVRLSFSYNDGEASANPIRLYAEQGSEVTLVMDYVSEGEGTALVQTKIYAEEGAKVNLIQVNRHSKGYLLLNDVGVKLCDNAEINIINLFLGGKETYAGCHTELAGKESRLNTDIGYMTYENQKLDMNFVAAHTGKKTKSVINASGVLSDNGEKLFRGTIDFVNGSSGSQGDEKEDVLLLSEGVINRTIPIILCAEEDVEGNHGATIGRPDEDLMFYMESRGMSPQEIYEMMANARIDAVCSMIPDDVEKMRIWEYLGRGKEDE